MCVFFLTRDPFIKLLMENEFPNNHQVYKPKCEHVRKKGGHTETTTLIVLFWTTSDLNFAKPNLGKAEHHLATNSVCHAFLVFGVIIAVQLGSCGGGIVV